MGTPWVAIEVPHFLHFSFTAFSMLQWLQNHRVYGSDLLRVEVRPGTALDIAFETLTDLVDDFEIDLFADSGTDFEADFEPDLGDDLGDDLGADFVTDFVDDFVTDFRVDFGDDFGADFGDDFVADFGDDFADDFDFGASDTSELLCEDVSCDHLTLFLELREALRADLLVEEAAGVLGGGMR